MAAGNFIMYNVARERIGDGTYDMDNDAFKASLHTSTYTPNAETHANRAELTNELSTANGYTATGASLATVTWTRSTTTTTFDADDTAWTASGGNIGPFRIVVIYDDTTTSPLDGLVCYCDLGEDVTVIDGNTFTLQYNASGILSISGATS